MTTLKIEMVHDVVCSWCPIGYANLKQALSNLSIEADIRLLPYELNPSMDLEGEDIDDHLARRYEWNQSKRQDYRKNLLAVAKQAGVTIDFSKRTHYYNSNKAHRLIHWSEGYDKHLAMNELLMNAYFKRGLNISHTYVLLEIVEQLELDRASAEHAITSEEVYRQIRLKSNRVKSLGIRGTPAFIFNEFNVVNGSNSAEYFQKTILQLLRTRQSMQSIKN